MPNDFQYRSLRLDKLARLNYGKSPKELSFGSGTIPVVGTGNEVRFADKSLVSHASIVIARKGTLSKPVFLETPFWPIDTTFYLSHFKGVLPKFLFYSLSTVDFASLNESTGVPSLSRDTLYRIELQIPDLKRQEYVVKVISDVDALIVQTEALIAKHERLRAGLLHDLLTYGVDEQGRRRSEETHEFKDSAIGRIPVEWEVAALRKLADAIDPQPDHRTPAEVEGGIPYVGIGDFDKNGKIDLQQCRRISEEAYARQRKRFKIEENDVVFGKIGTIGQPKLLAETGFALSANVILLKPRLPNSFLYWLLNSDQIIRQVDNEVARTTQPAFGIGKIRALLIKKPTNDECAYIAKILDNQEQRIKRLFERLDKIKYLKVGLMHDLLTPPTVQAPAAPAVLQEAEALFA